MNAKVVFYGCCGLALAVLLPLAVWWQIYRYHDCLKVGHTKRYCVLEIR